MPRRWAAETADARSGTSSCPATSRSAHRSNPTWLIDKSAYVRLQPVLAVDKDFELIAAVTGQPVETLDA